MIFARHPPLRRSYQHFCRCGKELDGALERTGAKRIAERTDVNKEDWKAVNGWMEAVITALATLSLKTAGELGLVSADSQAGEQQHKKAATKKWGKSRPYPGRVVALQPLCNVAGKDDKNTYRVEFDMGDSGMAYMPGDALGIYPTNAAKVRGLAGIFLGMP